MGIAFAFLDTSPPNQTLGIQIKELKNSISTGFAGGRNIFADYMNPLGYILTRPACHKHPLG